MCSKAIRALAALVVLAGVIPSVVADPIFNVTALTGIIGDGLNNNGQVIGQPSNAAPPTVAPGGVLYDGYGPNAGTTYSFGPQFVPSAINDSGLMVGFTVINNEGIFSYATAGGAITPVQNGGEVQGAGDQLNAAGQTLFSASGPTSGTFHSFIYNQDGTQIPIPLPPGQSSMSPSAINDAGQVAGWTTGSSPANAFLYSGGVVKSLGALPGDTSSMAYAINKSGEVVGVSQSTGAFHGFLYSNGAMQSLGSLGAGWSVPQGINASGEIYGYSATADGVGHAFLYINGKMIDLTNLLHSLTGSISQYANYSVTGLNDNGQVLVQASNLNSDTATFLLTPPGLPLPTAPGTDFVNVPLEIGPYGPPVTPVPEPSAAALFALVIVALGGRRLVCRKK